MELGQHHVKDWCSLPVCKMLLPCGACAFEPPPHLKKSFVYSCWSAEAWPHNANILIPRILKSFLHSKGALYV